MQRFWNKVDKSGDCWLWTAGKMSQGYGRFRFDGKLVLAHRMSWLLTNGEIPDGMCALHSCDNPSCVNPSHLRLGTKKDNAQDKIQRGRDHNLKRTHCKNGHELTPWKNRRYCKVCKNMRQRARKEKVGA